MGRVTRPSLVLTCEHASRRLPATLGSLGLDPIQRTSHIAWDRGAARLTRALAHALECPAALGRYSRLAADLNRSPHHPRAVPAVAFGTPVPGNADLTPAERSARIAAYHAPWRAHAYGIIERAARRPGGCVHLSIHSFTPELHGTVRRADVGLLYDPGHRRERRLAAIMRSLLGAAGFLVRRNYPYRGTSDGFTTWCRRRLPPARYIGIEIELNQRLVGRSGAQRRVVDAVAAALERQGLRSRPVTASRLA